MEFTARDMEDIKRILSGFTKGHAMMCCGASEESPPIPAFVNINEFPSEYNKGQSDVLCPRIEKVGRDERECFLCLERGDAPEAYNREYLIETVSETCPYKYGK